MKLKVLSCLLLLMPVIGALPRHPGLLRKGENISQHDELPRIKPGYEKLNLETHLSNSSTIPPIAPRVQESNCPSEINILGCGAYELPAGTFYIQSPNYPHQYLANVDCEYFVIPSPGNVIDFSCPEFSLEDHYACDWDFLEVQDGKYCGTERPPPISGQSSLDLHFHSDDNTADSGYSCTISVVPPTLTCGSHTLPDGIYRIRSPNYPDQYDNEFDCEYNVIAADGGSISFECMDFDLEQDPVCEWDWLEINGEKFCGINSPPSSSNGALNIHFHTDSSDTARGYSCRLMVVSGSSVIGTSSSLSPVTPPPLAEGCSCGIVRRHSRIVGGEDTEVHEYPWQVGIVSSGGSEPWCGGAIVNSLYILTAAHCTRRSQPNDIEVLIKEHRIYDDIAPIRMQVDAIIEHPNFVTVSSSGYDFALLKVARAIDFPSDNTVAPVCLPPDTANQYVGVAATVTGWGHTSAGGLPSTVLQEVTVPVHSNAVCSELHPEMNPSMLCAGYLEGGHDSCQGDSGGPLVAPEADGTFSVIGVVSWGHGCAEPYLPGVYARVTTVLDWIRSHIADGQFCAAA